MTYLVDMSLPSEQMLIRTINYENNLNLTLKDVTILRSTVQASNRVGWDTMVCLRANFGTTAFYGYKWVYYDRIDLSTYFKDQPVSVPRGLVTRGEDALPFVLDELGVNLGINDIYDDVFDMNKEVNKLRISVKSIAYKGYLDVQAFTSIANRVLKRRLNGFTVPIDQ